MIVREALPLLQRRPIFNHEWQAITFYSDHPDRVFLDRCQFRLEHRFVLENGEFLLHRDDLQKLYAPDLRITVYDKQIHVEFELYKKEMKRQLIDGCAYFPITDIQTAEMQVNIDVIVTGNGEQQLSVAPRLIDGELYIPVLSLMHLAFGAQIQKTHEGDGPTFWARPIIVRDIVSISFDPGFNQKEKGYLDYLSILLDKEIGEVYGAYWFEDGNRIMPYRAYIPTTYDRAVPNKALFYFHGGTSNENTACDDSDNEIERYAEDYGYIYVALSGYGISTFFGSLIPIVQTLDGIEPHAVDPKNPEGWPEETLRMRRLALKCAWLGFETVWSHWNIDRKNLFSAGNSAGSNACMFYQLEYPDLFNATAPNGGFINYNFADLSKLRDNSVFSIIGTEDRFGFKDVLRAHRHMDELGIKYKKKIVGGGYHEDAWTKVIDLMFQFFEENIR